MLHRVAYLAFDFLVSVCLLVLVIDVVDSDFIVLSPELGDTQLDHFQPVLVLVDGVYENVACGGFLVWLTKNRSKRERDGEKYLVTSYV